MIHKTNSVEVWMRGPLPDISALLQPIAHTLLQAEEEIFSLMAGFPDPLLWEKPNGVASVGFHLQHITGVLDRLFTYARGEKLSEQQFLYLKSEGQMTEGADQITRLLNDLSTQIKIALKQLRQTDSKSLTEFRGVGRQQLPSTVLGLLFHSAEHTMRHVGQLSVTVRILYKP